MDKDERTPDEILEAIQLIVVRATEIREEDNPGQEWSLLVTKLEEAMLWGEEGWRRGRWGWDSPSYDLVITNRRTA